MPTFIAFLRAVNVGGHNMVPMKKLVAALEAAGFASVSSYLHSGNVTFTAEAREDDIKERFAEVLRDLVGFTVPIALWDTRELAELCERLEDRHSLVTFFTERAGTVPEVPLQGGKSDFEVVRITERYALVVVHGPKGDLKFLERAIGAPTTSRYPRVVREVLRRATAG